MKTHYSVAEILDLNFTHLPNTRKGLDKYLSRNQWKYREVPSRGKGGIKREYELPDEFKELIVLKNIKTDIAELSTVSTEISVKDVNSLQNWQVEIAENRLYVVRYVQEQVRAGRKKTNVIEQMIANADAGALLPEILQAILKANAKAGNKRTVSRRSVFDWIKAVEDAEKHKINVLSLLAPKARTVAEIPKWAVELLKLWGQPQKPTLTACLELLPQYLGNDIPCPSYAQAYRFLNEKMGNVDVQKGRMGNRELKNIKGFVRRDTENLLPTDVYTADGHCFDAEIAHPIHGKPFRPEITAIIDVASRRIVGWSIDLSENKWAVLDAIRMAATECGIPAMFYVDNGSGYKNAVLTGRGNGILSRLNVTVSHALPYNSQAKGLIERSHQTLWIKAAKTLPTYIGKDMDAEAGNKVHKLTRKDIIQFGQSQALMKFADFVVFAEQVVADYNNKPHSSLKRITDPVTMKSRYMSPLEMWAATLDDENPIDRIDNWDMENFFRPTVERKVRRCEIELFSNRYFHRDLEQFHDEVVQVGYDIHDAEHVTVRDMEGRLICIAEWNANKRDYFPKAVIEQAREQRAAGRLRRLAAKQAEVVQELNPQQVIEHLENQTNVLQFKSRNLETVRAEMEALPFEKQKDNIFFKDQSIIDLQDTSQHQLTGVERWVVLDQQIFDGFEISEEDRDFWESYQLSKKFKRLCLEDEALKEHLERLHGT
ncbi:Mu transposase C-terminal domain-containing protein [Acinetobacter piscicola]|uniref:Mu transposase C-terminal domain-containing protein n=1 Tax=Acinetobacter piscicola TaxID=2006115 RepID=UPI0010204A46|nr:Mu transposase C-terminal domain-containing protein [Acinetobacter piscicola]RYL25170.1 transposase [Acinetobacter piscicola]